MNLNHVYWLDDNGHVKPPLYLYLMLAFLARGWVVWVMSLTQHNDRAGLVRLLYPQQSDFIQALIVGLGAVLIFALVLAERKRKLDWLAPLFAKSYAILWLVVLAEIVMLWQRLLHAEFLFHWGFALDALASFWCVLYLLKSKHLKAYFRDWQLA
ncbi:DUF2919 domain-containing protein [Shewanella sp. NFH-SH190041]|uniref:DUF2919 domain-containing protein n=1 Tax=Shewanella sp. NFH-SH190041 TaxID=2950245 RepID=UPI0021C35CF7|nr:DUF2919 domain-containing protein [Shewanella sp. NFH-SH190041]